MNLFKRVRIDRLFFGSFASFLSILLLVFTWISYSTTSKELANTSSYYQQDMLNELNKQIDIQLKSIEQMSLAASRNMNTIGYDPFEKDPFELFHRRDDMLRMLASITYSTTMVQSIYLYIDNPTKTDPQAPVQILDMAHVREESWYPEIEKLDFTWVGERTLPTNKGPQQFISFARKLYNNSDKYYGLLMLNVKATAIEGLVRGGSAGKEKNRLLLDASGRTIATIGKPTLSENDLGLINSKENASNYIHLPVNQDHGEGALLVWSKVRSDWMLIEITPWNEIVHGSIRLAYILVSVGLTAIFITAFFTLFLSRQFTKPIRLLLSRMGRVPAAGAVVDLPTDYENEFGSLFNGYRRQMERIEELLKSLQSQHKRKREAEILALQAMINPHFLYNTLDQLNWIAIDSGQEKISTIVSLMGKMFRIGLSNGETVIPIRDELTHVECYLQIQKIRWGERLTYSMDIEEDLKDLYISRLTIQPFVENAFIHGFHGRRTGEVNVSLKRKEYELEIIIRDNGVGLKTDWASPKPRKTGGYGVRNVMDRIAAYFGEPYGVTLRNREEGGTEVVLLLPILHNKTELEDALHVESTYY
ncbi:sensor histidine kinase [Paenibacillus qinlingensis]|uniref:Two-component system sensor histidine kinase YesM n=1 Tax=Paenibacillus qinlingensis TaxID=1837343 RepID=A0ABU1P5G0_9BACL|nr:sensor histidine kinase [Paenibacillus qinlingensis]MDR6554804.1 two-component system sensor histidine kinase YesM [Paenibacillus qinlingensis]